MREMPLGSSRVLGWGRWSELGRIVGVSPAEARRGSLLGRESEVSRVRPDALYVTSRFLLS